MDRKRGSKKQKAAGPNILQSKFNISRKSVYGGDSFFPDNNGKFYFADDVDFAVNLMVRAASAELEAAEKRIAHLEELVGKYRECRVCGYVSCDKCDTLERIRELERKEKENEKD